MRRSNDRGRPRPTAARPRCHGVPQRPRPTAAQPPYVVGGGGGRSQVGRGGVGGRCSTPVTSGRGQGMLAASIAAVASRITTDDACGMDGVPSSLPPVTLRQRHGVGPAVCNLFARQRFLPSDQHIYDARRTVKAQTYR